MPAAQDHLPEVLTSHQASLASMERLAKANLANAGWQRDLSVSQEKVGDVLHDQGDLSGALAAYRAGLAIRERLAAQDRANAGWQRDLSVFQEKIDGVLRDHNYPQPGTGGIPL